MSEPRRAVTGLPRVSTTNPGSARPVTGDLSGLQAKNRSVAPAQQQVDRPAEPAEKKQSNKAVTVYISPDVYTQARLAFNATRTAEADRNWSHFVEKAIAEESRRRAALHNEGESFEGIDGPLSPGRPLSDH
ncbi:ParB family protein [Rhodococcus chondri]|uniref:Centromere-binding protein ParB C-terminal domain-containing protein n=1 Tax=Rhodococcus chondri TaxID=3065941 RepID=A0ABU7JTM8_9NOCA|nr:hypothetical protein [Rhodococcus sp. CC-R104]MEE2033375.1 hypothetical protein [Rhodococcus sp. CC-R104]